MTDPEQEHVMERIEQIREDIEVLQEHPMVEGYMAEGSLGHALINLEEAYADIARADT